MWVLKSKAVFQIPDYRIMFISYTLIIYMDTRPPVNKNKIMCIVSAEKEKRHQLTFADMDFRIEPQDERSSG